MSCLGHPWLDTAAAPDSTPSPVVAKVGAETITAEMVRLEAVRSGYNIYEATSYQKALDDLIRLGLLAAEAQRSGLARDPDLARRIKELLAEALVRQKVDAAKNTNALTEAELLSYYQAHTNDFSRPAMVRGAVISLLIQPGKEAETQARAREALKALRSGEKVDAVVRRYSDDPSERASGGQGNLFVENQPSRKYQAEVAAAMLSLRSRGECAGPVVTKRAIYVVSLGDRMAGQIRPFEEVKGDVKKRLAWAQREQATSALARALRTRFPVTIHAAELDRLVQQVQTNKGPPRGPVGGP